MKHTSLNIYFQSKNDQNELQSQKLHEDKISDLNKNELYDSDAEGNMQESILDTLVDDENLEHRTLVFAPGENQ